MLFLLSTLLTIVHAMIVVAISVRVIMRRPANGDALAWLFLVAVLPFVGGAIYLLVGERRVGLRRPRRIAALRSDYAMLAQRMIGNGLTSVDWDKHRPEARGMDRLGAAMVGVPTVAGSKGHLCSASDQILKAIAADVDRAARAFSWSSTFGTRGRVADEVLESLIRAANRGVSCRVLVDALGARPWWRGPQPARLRAAGVHSNRRCPSDCSRRS